MSCWVAALAQEHGVHQSAGDGAALVRQRNGNAGSLADRVGLAQDDVENRSINGAIRRVEQHGSNDLRRLTEAIHATFPLLMTGRVPGQIVVDDGIEQGLEVDAFREAVGCDQKTLIRGQPCPRRERAARPP